MSCLHWLIHLIITAHTFIDVVYFEYRNFTFFMFYRVFYSVDFRNRTLKNGNHWSPEAVLGSRVNFNVEESILLIDRVTETDAGIYKCRIDYDKFPTKNYIVNLSVIG